MLHSQAKTLVYLSLNCRQDGYHQTVVLYAAILWYSFSLAVWSFGIGWRGHKQMGTSLPFYIPQIPQNVWNLCSNAPISSYSIEHIFEYFIYCIQISDFNIKYTRYLQYNMNTPNLKSTNNFYILFFSDTWEKLSFTNVLQQPLYYAFGASQQPVPKLAHRTLIR